jgi:hypothetical protein
MTGFEQIKECFFRPRRDHDHDLSRTKKAEENQEVTQDANDSRKESNEAVLTLLPQLMFPMRHHLGNFYNFQRMAMVIKTSWCTLKKSCPYCDRRHRDEKISDHSIATNFLNMTDSYPIIAHTEKTKWTFAD